VQINGASSQGIRQSVALWNDTSGNSFQDASGYGVLTLIR
jgi:endo-1,4-beta-xylanase